MRNRRASAALESVNRTLLVSLDVVRHRMHRANRGARGSVAQWLSRCREMHPGRHEPRSGRRTANNAAVRCAHSLAEMSPEGGWVLRDAGRFVGRWRLRVDEKSQLNLGKSAKEPLPLVSVEG